MYPDVWISCIINPVSCSSMGTLYIVSTPIGNLQDISIRAIKVLNNVDFIACEDTRKTRLLLKFSRNYIEPGDVNSHPDLISYYEHNEMARIPQIINALKNNNDIALVSDAGTPAISDPGFKLIRECIRQGIKVESIPGPSSIIQALVISGLPTDKFLFLGYFPKKPGRKKKLLESIKESNKYIEATIIAFEAPHRLLDTLKEILSNYGDIEIVVARELTKIYEEVKRGSVSDIIKYYSQEIKPKGEFVILFSFKA